MSYYKAIYDVKYDRNLLEFAESLTDGQGDGRISTKDVEAIQQKVRDGNRFTNIEMNTLRLIYETHKNKMSDTVKILLLEFMVFSKSHNCFD